MNSINSCSHCIYYVLFKLIILINVNMQILHIINKLQNNNTWLIKNLYRAKIYFESVIWHILLNDFLNKKKMFGKVVHIHVNQF